MNDEELLGYLLNLHDAKQQAAIAAQVARDPEMGARLESLRAVLGPLECDFAAVTPPAGLALRTIAHVAAHLVEHEPRPRTASSSRLPAFRRASSLEASEPRGGSRLRAELIVALGLGFVAIGLGFSVVAKLRQQSDAVACPNNLRALHAGLTTYADTHDGRFPQVGAAAYPTAGSFVPALVEAGQFPAGFKPSCPGAVSTMGRAAEVPYTYTLGYRTPHGELVGLRRSASGENDLVPIAADYPASCDEPCDTPRSPHVRGQNVLYVGGNVRFATNALAGLNGDNIYRNQLGQISAGVDRNDTVLGRSADRP